MPDLDQLFLVGHKLSTHSRSSSSISSLRIVCAKETLFWSVLENKNIEVDEDDYRQSTKSSSAIPFQTVCLC